MSTKDTHNAIPPEPLGNRPLPCEEIQALMLDYMERDLGQGRSDLVREHIRRCPACNQHFSDIRKTCGLLHDAPFANGVLPEHLSARHHDRLVRAIMHPVLDWIYAHHILVSLLIALLVVATAFIGLRHYRVCKETNDPGIPVTIGSETRAAADSAAGD